MENAVWSALDILLCLPLKDTEYLTQKCLFPLFYFYEQRIFRSSPSPTVFRSSRSHDVF